ncbi:MAG TPA: 9-O-acetyl-N-acetylneuraminate esterase [Cyanobacteria bacterium UBA8803]|nr:9-O-acetyl-N-acetylneuraminate esterase [Cyanobacteria bacterium UBA9273]HBL61666.1 9-O-acetyl-N-acetylneuraminate esterase [Cyanobacteria bacterium UBA8803]
MSTGSGKQPTAPIDETPTDAQSTIPNSESPTPSFQFRLYRQAELLRTIASLKANSCLLLTGEEGSGKTVLMEAIFQHLTDEGFMVACVELATTKQMLLNICEQTNIDTYTLEGKALTIDQLKDAIVDFFKENVAFLVIDDAHRLPLQFRQWLKVLKRKGVSMLLLATRPPKSDIFLNLPRIELKPLPEYAIRELMEQAALERGLKLANHELAQLHERAGGNPMLAQRIINEEYLGLDVEGGDHGRYRDATPLVILGITVFSISKFFALGINEPILYVLSGSISTLLYGIYRILLSLPGESKRIE